MKNESLCNEKGFLHPFLLFLTAFFLLLLTSGTKLLANQVQSTDLLFEQYKIEQAASIASKTFEQHHLPQLDEKESVFKIKNQAVDADITITREDEQILAQYSISTDYMEKPMTFYKTYPSNE
ncbi:hypothetical protein SFC66_07655 [Terribacillus saccharophilus]|uniref:hypothetical protein n=1 Tax=Terribacillus saccharophilus TaxID=361277 RepID=UPI00398275D2